MMVMIVFSWRKYFLIFFCIYLLLEKLVNKKHFLVKEKLAWFPEKCFFKKFGRKIFSGSCEKFRKVILFANYIKFGPQTFDCYIYLFWIFIFQFHLLKFNFYINFDPYFYNCYLLFPYYYFYLSILILILLIVTYFIWNNLWNINYYYFNFFIFYFFIF